MVEGEKDPESVSPRKLADIKVREVMNKGPRKVRAETSIDDLIERMLGQIESCFPVVDKDDKLIGIVTESDLFQMFRPQISLTTVGSARVREILKYSARTVENIMTKRPISVSPDMKIGEAMNLMVAHKVRRLPVVEGEKLVGLLTLRDIIKLYRVVR